MPSRISGACVACRSKKQKCSGDRAGCRQCQEAGHECTWPEQRKRGPAKGYIEGLEHRLHEAEQLLLQLLPIVTPVQLNAAITGAKLSREGVGGSPSHLAPSVSPPILNKKIGIEYWEQFPLDTPENIRRWQQDCAEGHVRRPSRAASTHADSPQLIASESFEESSRPALDFTIPAKHTQLPQLQAEPPGSGNQTQGGLGQTQTWPAMYQSCPTVTPSAFPQGVNINSVNCTPWAQHDHSTSSQIPTASGQYTDENGSRFFPSESQRQLFW